MTRDFTIPILWGDEGMPKRKLHIVHASDPLFAVCERCNARFKSFAANLAEAEKEVQAAFDAHKCTTLGDAGS